MNQNKFQKKMKRMKTLYDAQDGDIVWKNTQMSDTGKNFFMRVVNEVTTGWQNLQRKIKGQPKVDGQDHTELLMWYGTILETHSSVSGSGPRSQSFVKWIQNEGDPEIVILRRPKPFTQDEKNQSMRQIAIDRGLPYALAAAIKEGFTLDVSTEKPHESELMERGIFCMESSLRWSLWKNWWGMWPAEGYDAAIDRGYYLVFKGKASELLKI